jgi:erythromycin esterase-like protein
MSLNIKPFELNSSTDLSPLMDKLGEAGLVMLGEASHGTHEYYTWRSAISKRLIEEKKFSFIAVEGDWPDCYRINRYIKGYPDAGNDIQEVLSKFDRWPTWMWANWEIASFAEWLKVHNSKLPMQERIGFYGLDVYSLWESLQTLMDYLEKEDPHTAKAVKKAITCFDPYGEEGQSYAEATYYLSHSCKNEVLALLKEIRLKAPTYKSDREVGLNAEQNALIAVNAEKYYRSMIGLNNESWNVRDTHMMETLDHLMKFHGENGKGIVWEHNTHIGDARATDMKKAGMINIGQLAREKYGEENVFLVGFGSYEGSVIAGREWGAPMQEMEVPPAREGSIEELLHKADSQKNKLLLFDRSNSNDLFNSSYPHRAIGVVYDPHKEKYGNYVSSFMSLRYDAFIFIDETNALHPMHLKPDGHKVPETYPFGL